ncbi:unnamed protein product [Microthlaspi erraticum]|uniref:Uncharacterized protein n=1 Tax=Microthlaspi erraticum TaxID=1685480 RepID=A0A6D2ISZ3_9BRAS|nr:unnamed protein product [Microthlaspi erraticum]CAA7050428.1 unnamed protein product [Microthlaspi erraticum]
MQARKQKQTSSTVKFLHKKTSLREYREDSTAKDSSYKAGGGNNGEDDDAGKNYNALIVYEPVKKMEMVPRKKQGLGFIKKLLFRRKRVSSKKCLALTM